MTFVVMRTSTLQSYVNEAVKTAIKLYWQPRDLSLIQAMIEKEFALQFKGSGPDDRGLLGEFDNVHARLNELQMEIIKMQGALDDWNATVAALSAKIDEFLARPAGLPAEKVAEMTAQLKGLLEKFGA